MMILMHLLTFSDSASKFLKIIKRWKKHITIE